MTGPYRPELAELVTQSIEHRYTVTAHPFAGDPFELPAESCTVAFSDDWSPYVQVSVTCAVPEPALLDQLDGRLGCRLSIAAGYVLPDRTVDVHHLANVALMDRTVDRPGDTMVLTGYSDELRAQDTVARVASDLSSAGVNELLGHLAAVSMAPEPVSLASDFPEGYKSAELAGGRAEPGDNFWDMMADIAASTGVRLYVDEDRNWRITAPTTTAGTPVHTLAVGEGGTLVRTSAGVLRSLWYNDVVLQYRWANGISEQNTIGRASVTGGPMAVGTVGRRTFYQSLRTGTTQARANNAAAAKVRQLVTRGRELTLSAASAYWLRPSHTVTVALPTGDPEAHLVKSVSFDLQSGLMDITTRQPANVTITTGE